MPQSPNRTSAVPADTHIPSNRDLTRFLERLQPEQLQLELFLTPAEAASYTGLELDAVTSMAAAGDLPCRMFSHSPMEIFAFLPSELDVWLSHALAAGGATEFQNSGVTSK